MDLLTRHGVPADVAEQMVVKTSRNAGKSAFGAAIGFFAFFVAWSLIPIVASWELHSMFPSKFPGLGFDYDAFSIVLLLIAVGMLVWGIHERQKWRRWTMQADFRKTGVEQRN